MTGKRRQVGVRAKSEVILPLAGRGKLLHLLHGGDTSYFKLVSIRKGQVAIRATKSFSRDRMAGALLCFRIVSSSIGDLEEQVGCGRVLGSRCLDESRVRLRCGK